MDAESLIKACGEILGGDLSGTTAGTARTAVEAVMPERYAMPFPQRFASAFHHGGRPTRTRRGQWHEMVQHLTDLAYLTTADFQAWHVARAGDREPPAALLAAVLAAVERFVAEDDYPDFRLIRPLPTVGLMVRLAWLEEFISPVVFRLAGYTSFDGDTNLRPAYRIGERSAYGRSIAFRIRVYFADYQIKRTERRAPYFRQEQLPFLHLLDNSLGNLYRGVLPKDDAIHIHPNLQALLFDGGLLFEVYRRQNRFLPDAPGRYYLQYRISDAEAAHDEPGRRAARLARRAERRVERNELHADTGTNRLGVRLLQLNLWRAGFYTGVLDGAFGPVSHRAVVALLEQERESGEWKERKLDRVLLRASGTDWLVDLKLVGRLLDNYAPPSEEEAEREEAAIWEAIGAAGQEETIDREFAERQREIKLKFGQPETHRHRRVYFGLRSLLRGAFRAIGRVIRWIARTVEEILGAVFDFVKVLAKRLQEGIGLFFTGFRYFGHFLLGRPFLSLGRAVDGRAPVLLTRYQLDFDVVNVADASASGADVRAHQAYLRRMAAGADYFLETATGAIRVIALLQPPVGWLRLGVMIARYVRKLLTTYSTGRADSKR